MCMLCISKDTARCINALVHVYMYVYTSHAEMYVGVVLDQIRAFVFACSIIELPPPKILPHLLYCVKYVYMYILYLLTCKYVYMYMSHAVYAHLHVHLCTCVDGCYMDVHVTFLGLQHTLACPVHVQYSTVSGFSSWVLLSAW